jgi:hypothetical protein
MTSKRIWQVVAIHYPDLEQDYDGPSLSLDDQCAGVERTWPFIYHSRAEAEVAMERLKANPDPSFNGSDEALYVAEYLAELA